MYSRLMILSAITVMWAGMVVPTCGQIKGTKAGSADALERIQKQRDLIAAGKQTAGVLSVSGLKVGASGRPDWIDAKVMQVIDPNQMLVGIEDGRTGNGRYTTWVMVKCRTAGITDGKFWRGGQWKEVTGSEVLIVTGTTTYMTTGGGTSTVFVLEGVNANAKPAPVVKAPTVSKKAIGTGAAKTGAAAYDDFIDPVRELLVKAWESEVDAIKRAIKDDEERGRMAKTPKERQHFERNIADYKARLARVEKNDPPYVNLDVLKKRK